MNLYFSILQLLRFVIIIILLINGLAVTILPLFPQSFNSFSWKTNVRVYITSVSLFGDTSSEIEPEIPPGELCLVYV